MIKQFIVMAMTLMYASFSLALTINNLREQRYCEVFLGDKIHKAGHENPSNLFLKPMKVYNTIGLNNCPEKEWQSINIETIKQKTGAKNVKLNGPRMWMIDGMKNSTFTNSQIQTFNGISMRQAGTLELPLRYVFKKPQPYQSFTVERNTTWVYLAGKSVYELIDPNGNTYVMQSYSLEPPQTKTNLNELQQRLEIPKGWCFNIRVLKENYYLTPVNKKAQIIQDNLSNTYQLET